MKLKRRRPEEPPVEIRATVPAEVATALRSYCRYYETTYDERIDVPAVVVEILAQFLRTERQFRRWRRQHEREADGAE